MKYRVYAIVNDINEKVYVGYTSKSLSWRLSKHFEDAEAETFPTRKLFKAMKQFSKEHFSINLLYESNDKNATLGQMEQFFIDKYDAIEKGYNHRRGGGGAHITEGQCKGVDVYDKDGNFMKTFPSRVSVSDFIGCAPGSISTAIANADNNKGSQVHGYWVCHHGRVPGYKTPNTIPGSEAACRVNRGKKRPQHSQYMKENPTNVDNSTYVFVHPTEERFCGTRQELINTYPEHKISSSELGMLIRGSYQSHRCWRLEKPL